MEIIIAQSVNDFDTLKKHLSKTTDILVFEQNIMILLDKKGIKYKVIEDFYSEDQFYVDVGIYRKKVEYFLNQLDKNSEKIAGFPYAFSGNEHYLSTWFDDLMYLEKLIKIMGSRYEKIYLYAPQKPEPISGNKIIFSKLNSRRINGTVSFPRERLGNRIIQLIYNSIQVHFLADKSDQYTDIPTRFKISHFFYRLKNYCDRKLNFNNLNKKNHSKKLNKKIYLIQDTYDVTLLKNYLPKLNFLNPITQLRQDIELEKPVIISDESIKNIIKNFVQGHFFYLNTYINLLINSYHKEVVGRLSSFNSQFKLLIKKDKPDLFLLGAGTRDVFDTACCYLANVNSIPIIVFQHGGTRLFSDKAYDESLEYNKRVSKTLIVHSKKDVEKFQNNKTKVLCMGSIQQYEKNQLLNKNPTKDICLCLGPDINFSFRHLLEYYSTGKKHQQSIEVISTIEEALLSVDIKLHPQGERSSLNNYLNIIKDKQYNHTKIIYGRSAETVLSDYKLIIIDFIASAVCKYAFSLKIPVILYNRDFDKMRVSKKVLSDLSNRCYIARNKVELRDLLKRYQDGKLPSKWSESFIDNYIYPIANGNPGVKITEYIENLMLNTN